MKNYQKSKYYKVDMRIPFSLLRDKRKKYLLAYPSVTWLVKLISTLNMENHSRCVMNYTLGFYKTKDTARAMFFIHK